MAEPKPSQHQPSPPSYDIEHISQSQHSSFNESMSSQTQDQNDKGSSQPSNLLRAATPATSVSNVSSQEQMLSPRNDFSISGNENLYHNGPAIGRQPATSRDRPTSAPKRMLNGDIKSSTSSHAASPVDSQLQSRRSSRESQASDVCRELPLRLRLANVCTAEDSSAIRKV